MAANRECRRAPDCTAETASWPAPDRRANAASAGGVLSEDAGYFIGAEDFRAAATLADPGGLTVRTPSVRPPLSRRRRPRRGDYVICASEKRRSYYTKQNSCGLPNFY